MANYVSQHTGTEIDTAINQTLTWSNNPPWKPLTKIVTNTSSHWVNNTQTGNGHSAAYMATASVAITGYDEDVDVPMVWFMDDNGGRYYVDYSFSVSGTSGSLIVYSNTRIAGKICVLGLVHATAIS